MTTATLTLEDIVGKTTDLPSLPAAAFAVMRETDSPTGTAQSVAKALTQDQALTARVLRLANSAFYGLSRQVVDLPEAVIVLGMRSIRNLSLVASTYPWLTKPLVGYELGPGELWKHSFSIAIGAQLVAKKTRSCNPDVAFTCGLLHNLGKVMLSVWLENRLNILHTMALNDDLTFEQAEQKMLGHDHCAVGAFLGEKWNLPKPFIETMRFHHQPDDCTPISPIVDCVHVADHLVIGLGLSIDGDDILSVLSEGSMERLELAPEEMEFLTTSLNEAYEEYEKLFEEMER